MRCRPLIAVFLASASKVAGHPLCYDDTSTDLDKVMTFCPEQQAGACCTDLDEIEFQAKFQQEAGNVTEECGVYLRELICAPCHSFSGHLYARLLPTLLLGDGLTMKKDFCNGLVTACTGQGSIEFPTYNSADDDDNDDDVGEVDYCEMHAGTQPGDFYWSYPYTDVWTNVTLAEAFPDLGTPTNTLSVKQSPDGSMYFFVGQFGEIMAVDAGDLVSSTQVINIGPNATATIDGGEGGKFFVDDEQGLIDVAFDPNFDGVSGAFYLSYSVRLNGEAFPRNRLSKFQYSPGDAAATRASEDILLTTTPMASYIHSAGWVDFKPSDFAQPGPVGSSHDIYWSVGDGGVQTDPLNNGQNEANMLGAIMRITVSASAPGYTTPSGNIPSPGLPEICALGFRNPWRCGFDQVTDELYCGDVGHVRVEEIDIVECGNNYGWSIFEGSRCQNNVDNKVHCREWRDPEDRAPYTFPYFEYCHPDYHGSDPVNSGDKDICGGRQLLEGLAVIGGYVYRGERYADLFYGAYIFADNVNGGIYYLQEAEDGTVTVGTIMTDGSVNVIGFSQTIDGELMLIDRQFNVYHLPCGKLCEPTCLDKAEDLPTFESEGCFRDENSDALHFKAPDCGVGEEAMSVEICASYCGTMPDMEYMGVQGGSECFCGDSGDEFKRYGSADNCDVPCYSTSAENCGGLDAIEVFKLSAPVPDNNTTGDIFTTPSPAEVEVTPSPTGSTGVTSLGCFKDVETDRIMTLVDDSTTMSTEACAALCIDSAFFATQFGSQCWCGSSEDYDRHGTSTKCIRACSGDAGEFCGGYYAASVYSNSGVSPSGTPSPVDVTTAPSPVDIVTPSPVGSPDVALLGCFKDVETDRIMTLVDDSTTMSAEVCAALCVDSAFFATQFGSQCWCGSSEDYDRHGTSTKCNRACSGDAGEFCGGYYAASVYSNSGVGPSGTPSPVVVTTAPSPVDIVTPSPVGSPDVALLGCFKDVGTDRIMTLEIDTTPMSAEVCAALCVDSAFFATQFGSQCWCGSSDDYDRHGTSTRCNMACAGTAGEVCGGYDAASVYSNTGAGPSGTPSPVDATTAPSPVDVVTPSPVDVPTTPSPVDTTDVILLGCFKDMGTDRIMTLEIDTTPMSAEVCAALCVDSAFFATQFGSQCWCGSSDDYDRHGTSPRCNMACAGTAGEFCGGYDAASVYSNGGV